MSVEWRRTFSPLKMKFWRGRKELQFRYMTEEVNSWERSTDLVKCSLYPSTLAYAGRSVNICWQTNPAVAVSHGEPLLLVQACALNSKAAFPVCTHLQWAPTVCKHNSRHTFMEFYETQCGSCTLWAAVWPAGGHLGSGAIGTNIWLSML